MLKNSWFTLLVRIYFLKPQYQCSWSGPKQQRLSDSPLLITRRPQSVMANVMLSPNEQRGLVRDRFCTHYAYYSPVYQAASLCIPCLPLYLQAVASIVRIHVTSLSYIVWVDVLLRYLSTYSPMYLQGLCYNSAVCPSVCHIWVLCQNQSLAIVPEVGIICGTRRRARPTSSSGPGLALGLQLSA